VRVLPLCPVPCLCQVTCESRTHQPISFAIMSPLMIFCTLCCGCSTMRHTSPLLTHSTLPSLSCWPDCGSSSGAGVRLGGSGPRRRHPTSPRGRGEAAERRRRRGIKWQRQRQRVAARDGVQPASMAESGGHGESGWGFWVRERERSRVATQRARPWPRPRLLPSRSALSQPSRGGGDGGAHPQRRPVGVP
jgi:hypothetical protein